MKKFLTSFIDLMERDHTKITFEKIRETATDNPIENKNPQSKETNNIQWKQKEMINYLHQDYSTIGFLKYIEHYIILINHNAANTNKIPLISSLVNPHQTEKTISLEKLSKKAFMSSLNTLIEQIHSCNRIDLLCLYSYLTCIILINFERFEYLLKLAGSEKKEIYKKGSFEEFEMNQEILSKVKVGLWNGVIHLLKGFYDLEAFADLKFMLVAIEFYKENHGHRDAHFREIENYLLRFSFLLPNQSRSAA